MTLCRLLAVVVFSPNLSRQRDFILLRTSKPLQESTSAALSKSPSNMYARLTLFNSPCFVHHVTSLQDRFGSGHHDDSGTR
jgi:hypothetical protein